MPELPEVETTRRGLEAHLLGRRIEHLTVRNPRLRWPIPEDLPAALAGRRILAWTRRAKYLLLHTDGTGLLLHLGMSGSLRHCSPAVPLRPHDHWSLGLDDTCEIRFHDPRRFGCCLPLPNPNPTSASASASASTRHASLDTPDAMTHPLLRHLGPEPLDTQQFTGAYLFQSSRGRQGACKPWLMDQRVVVGVGNIYASEALFLAGIRPDKAAGRLTRPECEGLAHAVRAVLEAALLQGGTTLRDFVREDGQHGYFRQSLQVYGRAGQPCVTCRTPLLEARLGGRSSVFCAVCQV
jgi:formamidopyrimidine-DNA glycosylase